MRLRYVVGLLIVGLSLLFQESSLRAAMIPFGFWKNSVCTFSSNTTVSTANLSQYSGCVWDIQAGVTVTVNYTSIINIRGLTIANTGVLTHRGCTTVSCTPLALNVSGDVTIASGGKITANGLGYLGSYQTGPDAVTNSATTGQTYGFSAGAGTTAGGSHGGWGGWNSSLTANKPSLPFGIIKYPDSFGSGGGGVSASYKGGSGGGVIRMTIGGTLTLNGDGTTPAISANGADGNCGGGAGGSIDITAKVITSSTSGLLISANGGAGGNTTTCNSNNAGGGGGGRIAFNYTSSLGGTMAISSTFIRAYGGTQTNSTAAYYGGSGTIAASNPSSTSGDLYVYGPNNSTYTYNGTPIGAFGWISAVNATTITFTNYTSQVVTGQYSGYIVPDGDASPLQQQPMTTHTATTATNAAADLTTLTAVGKLWVIYDPRYNVWDNLNISDAAIVHSGYLGINTAATISNTAKLVTATITAPSLTLNNTAVLSHFPGDTDYVGHITISVTNMTVASGASVNVDGLGYLGGKRVANRGTNSSQKGMTLGLTTTGGADQDTGGSHGGMGGYDQGFQNFYPSIQYGSISNPVDAGSGGGTSSATSSAPGGNGGGVIGLYCTGTLTLNGTLSAQGGTNGLGSAGAGGGGAGGSILVNCPTITSSSSSVLMNANGGGGTNTYVSGGGGRISIVYTTLSGTMALSKARLKTDGGLPVSSSYQGGSGTVFAFQTGVSTYGNLYTFDDRYSNFRGSIHTPYGLVSSSTATTITDSGLTTNSRDFAFTKAQVVGKSIVVNPHLTSTTSFTITNYDASTGTFTVSGGSAAGLTANSYWYVSGMNTHFDSIYLSSSTKWRTPAFVVTNSIISASSKSPRIEIMRVNAGTIDFSSGSPVFDAWYSNGTVAPQPLVIAATTFNLGANARIDASGSGYIGGNSYLNMSMGREGWAMNATNSGYTNGNTTTGASAKYSGGSGAGYGGIYSTSTPATPFGDPLQPFTFGSGGGGDTATSGAGGMPGGGVVKLDVSGTLTVNGVVTVAGYPAEGSTGSSAGSGGGGSIWINAGTITCTTCGSNRLDVRGGTATAYANANGCGGGGGKLAIYYTTMTTFSSNNVASNGGGGNGNNCNGGAGIEYYKKASDTYGSMSAWNGSVPNYLPTPLPAYNLTLRVLEIYSGVRFKQMSSINSITVTTALVVDNSGGAILYVPNDQSNVTPYNNAIPVGTWFNASGVTGTITEY